MLESKKDLDRHRLEIDLPGRGRFKMSVLDLPGADPELPTAVFVHGAAGNLTQWTPQLLQFQKRVRIVTLDMRGHGRSGFPPQSHFVIDEFVQDLKSLVDLLKLPSFYLVGHSFGGAVAAAYAVMYPQDVSGLALIGTAGKIHLRPSLQILLKLPASLLNPIQRGFHNSVSAKPEVLKKLIPYVLNWRGWDLYPQIRCPSVGISGEWDMLTRPSAMQEMMNQIPDGYLERVSFAGHLPQLDRSRRVNEILQAFFFPSAKRNWRGASSQGGNS